MLFLLHTSRTEGLEELRILGGDEDKAVLLVGDAVYLGLPGQVDVFETLGVDAVFAARDAVSVRGVVPAEAVAVLGYDGMAKLILDDHDQVISL
ncbi:hypothetical protein DVDV_1664 [Desulfovibrio sp. DV]|uniref:hypothetical protein n=1 Tax=Desulfovibrio sp. DV TaxID=1844708 RepID=UPI00094B903D|nr:hypothetical protein [Desulfovibrio sp. DV]OLN28283.1 hypothetical protein DVDV_1664 [Desulfovibrio sp. DV]